MAYGPYADLIGAVTNTMATPADLVGYVEDGTTPADLVGTVSRSAIEAWDGPSLFHDVRVKLGDDFIPADELDLPVSIDEAKFESHTGGFEFTLRGRRWSIWATEKVFARTPVEIYVDHGPEGVDIESATPTYTGYVIGCDQTGGVGEPTIRVKCGDDAALWEKYEACEEVAPGADYTRGEIVRLLCDAAEVPTVDCPAGATYTKALQASHKKLFEIIKPFIEPEGWVCDFDLHTFRVWEPKIKLAPLAPDYTWSRADLSSPPSAIPPEDAPSRWVLTANTVVDIDELGVVTSTTLSSISAEYAPKVATHQQLTDGSVVATGLTAGDPSLIVVSLIQDVQVKRGDLVSQQRTQQWGWFNPSSGYKVTVGSGGGAGTAGGGYSYVTTNIDEEGNFVDWMAERFVLISERIETPTYDESGTITGSTGITSSYTKLPKGVRAVSTDPTLTTVLDSYVYADDNSYAQRSDTYGVTERVSTAYEYATTGGLLKTTQETYRYASARSRVDGPIFVGFQYYVLGNGFGQYDLTAIFQLVERKVEQQILKDGQVKGTSTLTYSFDAPKKADGEYDWGGGTKSNAENETFLLTHVEGKTFNILSENKYEVITYPPEGGRVVQTFLGRLPTTRYAASTWTQLFTQPIEEIVDDDTALAWFGFSREAFSHDYVLNGEEARRVIATRRRRIMCPKVEVTRPLTAAKRGDTILLDCPEDGIFGRFIVTEKRIDISRIQPVGVYRLEQWVS